MCFSDLCTAWLRSSTIVSRGTMQESPRSNPLVSPTLFAWLQVYNDRSTHVARVDIQPRDLELACPLLRTSGLADTLQTFASSHDISRDLRVRPLTAPVGSVAFTNMAVCTSTFACLPAMVRAAIRLIFDTLTSVLSLSTSMSAHMCPSSLHPNSRLEVLDA